MFPLLFRPNGKMRKKLCLKDLGGSFVPGNLLEAKGLGADKCLYLCWSPYFTQAYLGISIRGEVQRWKEHWRNLLHSQQNHELPHCRLIRKKGVCLFLMTVVALFHEDVTKNELEHFERIAITWFRPQFHYPLCQKWIRFFGQG